MWELIKSGGWLMGPLIALSIVSLALILERFWSLQRRRIIPRHLLAQVWHQLKSRTFTDTSLRELRQDSPLGRVLAAGIVNMNHERAIMVESIEDVGRQEAHELGRYLNTLGTIAAISPLMGLLGTVLGMIKMFNGVNAMGMANASLVAGGIAEALLNTAMGIIVAIPSLMAYRYFRGWVDSLVLDMEREALKLVEVIHGQRERDKEFAMEGGK